MQHLHAVPDDQGPPTVETCAHEIALGEAARTIENFDGALATARVISMSVGVLMATFRISSDAAFDMLEVASQNTGRTLRDIADEVVDTGTLNWGRHMVARSLNPVAPVAR